MGENLTQEFKQVIKVSKLPRISRYVILMLSIYFVFYGFICNIYGKEPGMFLLFVTFNFVTPRSWLSLFILIGIYGVVAYSDDYLIYAMRNALWTIPAFPFISAIYYSINYRLSYLPLNLYFGSIYGYLDLIVLGIVAVFSTIIGGYFKTKRIEALNRRRMI